MTAIPAELHPEERAAAIRSIGPGSELAVPALRGHRLAPGGEAGVHRLEALRVREGKVRAARLAAIPELFRDSSFESYQPRNPKQERALALMRKRSGRKLVSDRGYGSGKTHLLYAQYREMVTAGKIRCHVRTTRELVEELRRAEFDDGFRFTRACRGIQPAPYHLFWDDIDKLKADRFQNRGSLRSGRQPLPAEAWTDGDRQLFDAGSGGTRAHASGHRPPPG